MCVKYWLIICRNGSKNSRRDFIMISHILSENHKQTRTHSHRHTLAHTHSHQVQLPALLERDARYETRGGRVEQEEDAHAAKQFEIVKYSIYCMHFQRSSLTVSYWTLVE